MAAGSNGGTKAPGHFRNRTQGETADPTAGADREERHQVTRERIPADPVQPTETASPRRERPAGDRPDAQGAAGREERIRSRAYQLWEEGGRPEGRALEHWERAAQDLDREDAALHREGAAGEKPGVKSG